MRLIMGMGYGSNYADIISSEYVAIFCSDEHRQFMMALSKHEVDFNTFCQESEEMEKEIIDAFTKMQEAFNVATGLDLETGYHSSEDTGDKYDEVDGGYYSVDGMYEMTQAGKNIGEMVKRKFWVTFG